MIAPDSTGTTFVRFYSPFDRFQFLIPSNTAMAVMISSQSPKYKEYLTVADTPKWFSPRRDRQYATMLKINGSEKHAIANTQQLLLSGFMK
jgi:hypothetical protein